MREGEDRGGEGRGGKGERILSTFGIVVKLFADDVKLYLTVSLCMGGLSARPVETLLIYRRVNAGKF